MKVLITCLILFFGVFGHADEMVSIVDDQLTLKFGEPHAESYFKHKDAIEVDKEVVHNKMIVVRRKIGKLLCEETILFYLPRRPGANPRPFYICGMTVDLLDN